MTDRVWDVFMLRDELDMLECRLVQFDDFPVYKHVLVEATRDHQGHAKPLYYADNRERFAPWSDQIVHVVVDDLPDEKSHTAPLEREAAQRDATHIGLGGAQPEDWVIIADVDEIPNGQAFYAVEVGKAGVLAMKCCMFAVDWVWGTIATSPVMRIEDAGKIGAFSTVRRIGWSGPAIENAGHHLTWMGGPAKIAEKLDAHCHTETNADVLRALASEDVMSTGFNPFKAHFSGGNDRLEPVDVDESWPRWVRERRCPAEWFRPR